MRCDVVLVVEYKAIVAYVTVNTAGPEVSVFPGRYASSTSGEKPRARALRLRSTGILK